MMGLEVDSLKSSVRFEPHIPAGWTNFTIQNVKVGGAQLDLAYQVVQEDVSPLGSGHLVQDHVSLKITRRGPGKVELHYSPALSPRAQVLQARVRPELQSQTSHVDFAPIGRAISIHPSINLEDQHVAMTVPITEDETIIDLFVSDNFGIGSPYAPPTDGTQSSALKVISEQWNASHDQLQMQVAGVGGKTYELPIYNAPSGMVADGGQIIYNHSGLTLKIGFPQGEAWAYSTHTVTLRFPKH
jgi:hypothetical protein